MAKYENIRALAKKQLQAVTESSDRWKAFLRTAAIAYNYSFPNQLLIHEQSPTATAVADIAYWNNNAGRWVKRGAHGIAVYAVSAKEGGRGMIYLELFWSFFQVGLFSIGGGYAAMPLIQDQVVDIHPWLTMTGFADIMAIAEMTPGPIALNAATFVGIQVAGLPGALIATIGCLFPSCVIVMTLAYVYYRFRGLSIVQGVLAGLRPAVIAMIASAGISLLILALYGQRTLPADLSSFDLMALVIFLAGFFVLRKWKPSPIKVMAGAAVAGIMLYSIAA